MINETTECMSPEHVAIHALEAWYELHGGPGLRVTTQPPGVHGNYTATRLSAWDGTRWHRLSFDGGLKDNAQVREVVAALHKLAFPASTATLDPHAPEFFETGTPPEPGPTYTWCPEIPSMRDWASGRISTV